MADWQVVNVLMKEIGDMNEQGFDRALMDIVLAGGPQGTAVTLRLDLPMVCRKDETIAEVKSRRMLDVKEILRVAALHMAEIASSTSDGQPPDLPEALATEPGRQGDVPSGQKVIAWEDPVWWSPDDKP